MKRRKVTKVFWRRASFFAGAGRKSGEAKPAPPLCTSTAPKGLPLKSPMAARPRNRAGILGPAGTSIRAKVLFAYFFFQKKYG